MRREVLEIIRVAGGPLVALTNQVSTSTWQTIALLTATTACLACGVGSVTGDVAGADGGNRGGPDAAFDPEADAGVDLDFDYDTSGRWLMPPALEAEADTYTVDYDAPPPWEGGINCGGSFLAGTQAFSELLQLEFPQISDVGGYSCRQNTANSAETSVHGTGRAIDVFIPLLEGDADNALGDPVANWLVYHAETLGVQLVIWDRSRWIGVGSSQFDTYGGPVPHIDHLHVELTEEAAE